MVNLALDWGANGWNCFGGLCESWGSTVPFFEQLIMSKTLEEVAHLGIFFIVLLAGIESEPQELQQHSGSAFIVAFGGAIVPLICGFYLAWEFLPPSEVRSIQALLVGVTMSITSIPATMKVLTEFGLLHTRLGQTVVGAAIFDDVLGFVHLGYFDFHGANRPAARSHISPFSFGESRDVFYYYD